ncbi:MAG: response regulator transcription factor [Oliverpabstia sp.]
MRRILIAEDEIAINKMICMNLNITGYETIPMYDGQEVLDFLSSSKTADLAIVDVMMPKVDGFSLLAPLMQHQIPVIFLTARGDLESKIKGLTGGAEDYIVKPFEMLELIVRIEKVLSRFGKAEEVLELDGVTLDMQKRRVIRGGEILSLTPIEYNLLCSLARNKNIALSREKLLHEIWGFDFEGETRTVDVHVASLRKKTGVRIVAVPKVGYRLEVGE